MEINFANPHKNNIFLIKKIKKKINNVIYSNKYILGDENQILQKKIEAYTGSKYAVTLNSGTDAILCSLIASNMKHNDEILVPSHTATATISVLKLLNLKIKFVDIDLSDYNLDIKDLQKKITKKSKAIIAVHIYGNPSNIIKIKKIANKFKLILIEDCAQAMGTKFLNKHVGNFGDFGCFSFFPTKNLSAIGDAGAVIVNKKNLYHKLLKIRQYGWNKKRASVITGINSRCDELQAAILNVKIDNLDKYIFKRRKIADFYNKSLANLPIVLPKERKKGKHSYHLYVIRIYANLRKKFMVYMKKQGINLGIHYYPPNHKMKSFKSNNTLKNTDFISKQIVSLPIYPELKLKELVYITSRIKSFFKKNK